MLRNEDEITHPLPVMCYGVNASLLQGNYSEWWGLNVDSNLSNYVFHQVNKAGDYREAAVTGREICHYYRGKLYCLRVSLCKVNGNAVVASWLYNITFAPHLIFVGYLQMRGVEIFYFFGFFMKSLLWRALGDVVTILLFRWTLVEVLGQLGS